MDQRPKRLGKMNIGEVRQGKTGKWTLVFEDGDTVLATPEWDTAQAHRDLRSAHQSAQRKPMRRESLKMQESDWRRLEELAAATGSLYSGRPSWRRMILRIARGEVTVRATKRVTRRANDEVSHTRREQP